MKTDATIRWMTRLGYAFLLTGCALLSPLADFLPVEVAFLLQGELPPSGETGYYYRVVPATGFSVNSIPAAMAVAGIVFIATAWLLRRRRASRN